MTYENFEDTPVWQEAARLYELSEDLLENPAFLARNGFRDQLDRAALSVSNNIAEGFERGTTSELLYFLSVARGSAGETRSMLRVKLRRIRDAALKSQISALLACAISCSRQLRGWADSVQYSEIQGQRHLNERSRRDYDQKKRAGNFRNSSRASCRPAIRCAKTPKSAGSFERPISTLNSQASNLKSST